MQSTKATCHPFSFTSQHPSWFCCYKQLVNWQIKHMNVSTQSLFLQRVSCSGNMLLLHKKIIIKEKCWQHTRYRQQTHTASHRAHTAGSPASLPASCPACVPARWAAAGRACTRAGSGAWPECRAWGRRCTWPPRRRLWRNTQDVLAEEEEVFFTAVCQSDRPPGPALFVFSSSTETHMGFLPCRPVLTILTAFSFFCWASRQTWAEREGQSLLPRNRKKSVHNLKGLIVFFLYLFRLLSLKAHFFDGSDEQPLCPAWLQSRGRICVKRGGKTHKEQNKTKQQQQMNLWSIPPVIVGHGSTLKVQQLTGVNLAGVPRVVRAGSSSVGHMEDVVADNSQRAAGTSGVGHVDSDVEWVSRRSLVALQVALQLLIFCVNGGKYVTRFYSVLAMRFCVIVCVGRSLILRGNATK